MNRALVPLLAVTVMSFACSGPEVPMPVPDSGVSSDAGQTPDAGAPPPDAGPPLPEDDAVVVSTNLPTQMDCGASQQVTVTLKNVGTATWTDQYRLGAVDDSDPFSMDGRVYLGAGETVAPGATHAFTFTLKAPATAGSYTTDWRMVHELVRWFGATAAQQVAVACSFDLSTVHILNSAADTPSWAVTTTITAIDFNADGALPEFSKRDGADRWPETQDASRWADGGGIQYTIWLVEQINGQWFASGGIEYWYGRDHAGGPPSGFAMNWYYDPGRWGPMQMHQPAVGERVGFFVTQGDARNAGLQTFRERSNVVFMPFPADSGGHFTF